MYLSNIIRLDIAYAVSRLSRYNSNPNQEYWTTPERVLRFLKGTIFFGVRYTRFPSVVKRYTDANWISNSIDLKSTSGLVHYLAMHLIPFHGES